MTTTIITVTAAAVGTFTVLYAIKHWPRPRQAPNRIDLCKNHTCPECNE